MRIPYTDTVIVVQVNLDIMVGVIEPENGHFCRNQIEVLQKGFCEQNKNVGEFPALGELVGQNSLNSSALFGSNASRHTLNIVS